MRCAKKQPHSKSTRHWADNYSYIRRHRLLLYLKKIPTHSGGLNELVLSHCQMVGPMWRAVSISGDLMPRFLIARYSQVQPG